MTTTGTPQWTLTQMMRDTIDTHGLAWAIRYYAKRLTTFELRVMMRSAYLG